MAFGIKTTAYKIRDNFRRPKGERLMFIEEWTEELQHCLKRRKQQERFELLESLNDEEIDGKQTI